MLGRFWRAWAPAPHNKTGASWMPAPVCCLYFQPIKFEGVNAPFSKLYIWFVMRGLKRIGHKRGLDKISPESGSGWIWGVSGVAAELQSCHFRGNLDSLSLRSLGMTVWVCWLEGRRCQSQSPG